MEDICLNCGREHGRKLWGADCDCDSPNVVHQEKCNSCENITGQLIDDDYCGPEKNYCHECINKARKTVNTR